MTHRHDGKICKIWWGANALAARIARAATGRDHIAICGYHGWHDWYLSVNLKVKIIFQNFYYWIKPHGVPKALRNTCHTFQANDLNKLKRLFKNLDQPQFIWKLLEMDYQIKII